jgi:hypothetical protein
MRVRRLIGYVPQQLSIDGQLTGYENAWLFSRLFDVPRRQRRGRIRAALAQVGLEQVAQRLASTYSGGMVRRLELAQALVSRPRVLVQILRREQHRRAVLGEFLDGLPHLDARLGVEPGRRLVQEDDRRIPDEAHRDVEAAAHATRIRRHLPRGRVGQRETLEQVIRDHARVL